MTSASDNTLSIIQPLKTLLVKLIGTHDFNSFATPTDNK